MGSSHYSFLGHWPCSDLLVQGCGCDKPRVSGSTLAVHFRSSHEPRIRGWGVGGGRSPALQTEILGISIARFLLCFCLILSVTLLLICFLRSKGAASTSMSLIKNSSAFLIVTNVAGVILFVLVSLSEH